jgi:WD40 repeat protein
MVAVQRVSLAGVFVLAVGTAAAAQPVVLSGHTAPVSSVEWSPDGKMIASCGHDNTVRVWDVARGKEIVLFRGGKPKVGGGDGRTTHVKWNAQGTLVAFLASDGKLRVCDVQTARELTQFDSAGTGISAFDWRPDGRQIASATLEPRDPDNSDRFQEIWDAATGRVTRRWKTTNDVSIVRWNPDGTRVAFDAAIHDPDADKPVTVLNAQAALSLDWSPDGKSVATGGLDDGNTGYTAKVWDAASGKLIRTVRITQSCWQVEVAWSPDGKTLAITDGSQLVMLWNPVTGRRVWQLNGTVFQWRPDGSSLLVGDTFLVDARTGRILWQNVGVRTIPSPWGAWIGKQIPGSFFRWRPDGLALAGKYNNQLGLEYPAFSVLVWDFPSPFPKPPKK